MPVVVSPTIHVPGVQGACSDASGAAHQGWGAHAFGRFVYGRWAPRTQRLIEKRKISIKALELLTATEAVVLVDMEGKGPREGRYALKCDISTTCVAVNFRVAASAAIREALRIWHSECEQRKLTVRLIYVDNKGNSIGMR